MICLLLNIFKLHFLAIYKLQISIINAAKHTAMNKIRSLAAVANNTRNGSIDIHSSCHKQLFAVSGLSDTEEAF